MPQEEKKYMFFVVVWFPFLSFSKAGLELAMYISLTLALSPERGIQGTTMSGFCHS